jgi:hypothetical protein
MVELVVSTKLFRVKILQSKLKVGIALILYETLVVLLPNAERDVLSMLDVTRSTEPFVLFRHLLIDENISKHPKLR